MASVSYQTRSEATLMPSDILPDMVTDRQRTQRGNKTYEPAESAMVEPNVFAYWLHSHEEDTDGAERYRRNDYSFPPSRGRTGFEIKEDGEFVEIGIAPGDGEDVREGHWTELGEDRVEVQFDDGDSYVLTIVSAEEDSLLIRRE